MKTYNITPVPTNYKGYAFRSRLEARWAVYFDKIGIEWDYETDAYLLPNGEYYLIDFDIPEFGHVEIKALGQVTEEEKEKCRLLSELLKTEVALFEGSPDTKAYVCFSKGIECPAICFSHYTVRKWNQTPAYTGGEHLDDSSYVDEETKEAISYAKKYRFERLKK